MQHKPGKIKAKTNNTTEEKNTPKEGNKHTNDKNNKKQLKNVLEQEPSCATYSPFDVDNWV